MHSRGHSAQQGSTIVHTVSAGFIVHVRSGFMVHVGVHSTQYYVAQCSLLLVLICFAAASLGKKVAVLDYVSPSPRGEGRGGD